MDRGVILNRITTAIIDEHTAGPFTIGALTTTMAGDIADLIVGPADGLIMGPIGTAAAAGVTVFPAINNEPTGFDGSFDTSTNFLAAAMPGFLVA